MKIYILQIAFAAAALLAPVFAVGADAAADAPVYVEVEGKPYLKDAQGNLIRIEIKAPPIDESRKARPGRGMKYGAPHPSTWRIDESKTEAAAPPPNEGSAEGGLEPDIAELRPKELPYSLNVEVCRIDGERKKISEAVFENALSESARAGKIILNGIVLSLPAKKTAEGVFTVELGFNFSLAEASDLSETPESFSGYMARAFQVKVGEAKCFKLLSLSFHGGNAEYEVKISLNK